MQRYNPIVPTMKEAAAQERLHPTAVGPVIVTDGGRSKYFTGTTGDCVTRAVVVATGLDYKKVYDRLAHGNADDTGTRTARNGIYTVNRWFKDLMNEAGFTYTDLVPTTEEMLEEAADMVMLAQIDEHIPNKGTYILSLPRHYAAYIDGVFYDAGYRNVAKDRQILSGFWTLTGELNPAAFDFVKPKRRPARKWEYEYGFVCPTEGAVQWFDSPVSAVNAAYKGFRPHGEERTPYFKCRRSRPSVDSYYGGYDSETTELVDDGDTWRDRWGDKDWNPPRVFKDKVKVCCTRFIMFTDKEGVK